MPLQATSGAASYDAFGGGVAVVPTYIEDVFSTWLYTGNGSTQTITNGIDLSTKGGLVWIKSRGSAVNHALADTVRGANNRIASNTQAAQITGGVTAFNTNGFNIDNEPQVNSSSTTYASWTFREQAKFFDVVTYTGNGANRTIAHNLGSVPGCIIIKRTDAIEDWQVYHCSLANTQYMALDATFAALTGTTRWNSTTPTDTVFSLGTSTGVNASGGTYIAYIFAHNAGGFGLTGTDNVISCGSYTGNGSSTGPTVTLGYEPQWLLIKNTTSGVATSNWQLYDSMRGLSLSRSDYLLANKTDAENGVIPPDITPTATGFFPSSSNLWVNTNGSTYIYIAIRRGPMKVPTTGTSVFSPTAVTNTLGTVNTTGFPVDMQIMNVRSGSGANGVLSTRLLAVSSNTTSSGSYLRTPSTSIENTGSDITRYWNNTGFQTSLNWSGGDMIYWSFGRAAGFMDICAYTGTGATGQTISHNLTVVPEFIITKNRTGTTNNWYCYQASLASPLNKSPALNTNSSVGTNSDSWRNITSSSFQIGSGLAGFANENGSTYVAYLFATCVGVSKVGSYTGTAATLQIDCGFTGGARFVLIKRTDSTGDWYVWDTARGIVSGNDPYLLINSTAAEVTSTDYIDTYSAGFEISSTAPAAINASGGSFIFLAIS